MKKHVARVAVVSAFAAEPDRFFGGADLWLETGVRASRLYSTLRDLEEAGWVETNWHQGRYRRRLYQLTDVGMERVKPWLAHGGKDPIE